MEGLALGGSKRKTGVDAVAEIISILFMSRDFAHKAHLKTSSYSEHNALGSFYDAVVGFADSLAEVAQGKYGKFDIPTAIMKGSIEKPVKGLEMQMDDIVRLSMDCSNGALKNIVDEIEALYLQTLYKLKELS